MSKDVNQMLISQLESETHHTEYSVEFSFYDLVKSGNIEQLRKNGSLHLDESMEGYGRLSNDPLRNLIYHFVVLAAMLARTCTEGGMSREKAYSLSDVYIRQADQCRSIEEIQMLHETMIIDYTNRMKYIFRERRYTRNVAKCVSLIDKSMNQRIKVSELADMVGVNRSHLSRIFKTEVGVSLSEYIIRQKIEAAETMLLHSNLSCASVAANFGFSSQSHFIQVFHKYTGRTPGKV